MLVHQSPNSSEDQYDPSLQQSFIDLRQPGYEQYSRPHWHYPSPPMSNSTPPTALTQLRTTAMPPSPVTSGYDYHHVRGPTIDISGVMPYHQHLSDHQPQMLPTDTRNMHMMAAAAPRSIDLTTQTGSFITSTPQNYQPPLQAHRRTKSHVASACVNCKKAHLACDVRRPCPRCVGLGKQDTCKDVQHKKRGRPRLRDDARHAFEVEPVDSRLSMAGQLQPGMVMSNGFEAMPQNRKSKGSRLQYDSSDTRAYSGQHIEIPLKLKLPNQPLTAFLTIDLLITFSSDSFQDYVGYNHLHLKCVRSLFDLVSPTDVEKLQRLCNKIKYDMREMDPSYVVPNLNLTIATIERLKLEEVTMATQNNRRFDEVLDIYRSDGQAMRTTATFTLAKRGVFFIFLEFANTPSSYPQKISPVSPQMSQFSRRSSSMATTDQSPTNYQYQDNSMNTMKYGNMINLESQPQRNYQPGHVRRTSLMNQGQPIPVQQTIDMYTPRGMSNDAYRQYGGNTASYAQPSQTLYEADVPRMANADYFPTARTNADQYHLPPLRASPQSHAVEALYVHQGNKRARIGVSEMITS